MKQITDIISEFSQGLGIYQLRRKRCALDYMEIIKGTNFSQNSIADGLYHIITQFGNPARSAR